MTEVYRCQTPHSSATGAAHGLFCSKKEREKEREGGRERESLSARHSVKFNRIPSCRNIENLVFLWAVVKVLKGVCEVLQESGTKHILVNTKLMA